MLLGVPAIGDVWRHQDALFTKPTSPRHMGQLKRNPFADRPDDVHVNGEEDGQKDERHLPKPLLVPIHEQVPERHPEEGIDL